ncbi:unnamed protein product [Moneuplotes crassus]|uniref:Uncharacterized protein n=1 Tax=Euplotes crassus TaxID=5936 RepID=A0AAD1U740_EUPCR|nr:unnamed protein product [Moneuplotes crassus]
MEMSDQPYEAYRIGKMRTNKSCCGEKKGSGKKLSSMLTRSQDQLNTIAHKAVTPTRLSKNSLKMRRKSRNLRIGSKLYRNNYATKRARITFETDDIVKTLNKYQAEVSNIEREYYQIDNPCDAPDELDKNQVVPITDSGDAAKPLNSDLKSSVVETSDEFEKLLSINKRNISRCLKINDIIQKTISELDKVPDVEDNTELKNKELELQIMQIKCDKYKKKIDSLKNNLVNYSTDTSSNNFGEAREGNEASIKTLNSEISELMAQKEMLSKLSNNLSVKKKEIETEIDNLPQIAKLKKKIEEVKAPIKDLELNFKTLQKKNLAQAGVMDNLNDQVKLLKYKKIQCLNGIDPNLDRKKSNQIAILHEQEKLKRMKIINKNVSHKFKARQGNYKGRRKILESQIVEMKDLLSKSKSREEKSLTKLEKLIPKYSEASILIRKMKKSIRQNAKVNSKASIIHRSRQDAASGKNTFDKSVHPKTSVNAFTRLTKAESEQFLAMEYRRQSRFPRPGNL